MTTEEILQLLQHQATAETKKRLKLQLDNKLDAFGVGLTQLRQVAKKLGRDKERSAQLWAQPFFETKALALLTDDPKAITLEQAENQIRELMELKGPLVHIFCSCDATLAKSPLARELVESWVPSEEPIRRRCGYGLLYELSKDKRKSAPDETFFIEWITHIERSFDDEVVEVKHGLAIALLGMGMRSNKLYSQVKSIAKNISPINILTENQKPSQYHLYEQLTKDVVVKAMAAKP